LSIYLSSVSDTSGCRATFSFTVSLCWTAIAPETSFYRIEKLEVLLFDFRCSVYLPLVNPQERYLYQMHRISRSNKTIIPMLLGS
jgi:hypothetical protein